MNRRPDPYELDRPGRAEPRLGDLEQLHEPSAFSTDAHAARSGMHHQRHQQIRQRRGWRRGSGLLWLVLIVLLSASLALVWLNQNKLRNLIPHTELNGLLGRADRALQAGHLIGNDGTSARELYEAARALAPDNDYARQGLRKVGLAEITHAEAELKTGQLDQARQALSSARELLGGGIELDQLSQALAQAQNKQIKTASLLDQAQAAMAADRIDDAAALYKRLLSADPHNALARHDLDRVGRALATRARKALDAGDAAAAASMIEKLAVLLPTYGELPALQAQLAQLLQQQQHDAAVAALIQQGDSAVRAGRFSGAGDDNALHYFQAALQREPGNRQAKAGLRQVAQAFIVQANAALESGAIDQAEPLLAQAAALAPTSVELAAAQARLQELAAQLAAKK